MRTITSILPAARPSASTLAACGKTETETEPVAPVKVAPAIRGSIRNIVTADAVLYPRDQANITSKISAPVPRGSS